MSRVGESSVWLRLFFSEANASADVSKSYNPFTSLRVIEHEAKPRKLHCLFKSYYILCLPTYNEDQKLVAVRPMCPFSDCRNWVTEFSGDRVLRADMSIDEYRDLTMERIREVDRIIARTDEELGLSHKLIVKASLDNLLPMEYRYDLNKHRAIGFAFETVMRVPLLRYLIGTSSSIPRERRNDWAFVTGWARRGEEEEQKHNELPDPMLLLIAQYVAWVEPTEESF